jgi:hypothetical protein
MIKTTASAALAAFLAASKPVVLPQATLSQPLVKVTDLIKRK